MILTFQYQTGRSGLIKLTICFSGDLGPKHTPILCEPDIPDPCDLLVLESTYGDRFHGDRTQRIEQLGKFLSHVLSDNGKVYIPSFALGLSRLYTMS